MKTYRFTIQPNADEKIKSYKVEGFEVKRGHAIFVRTSTDLCEKYEGDEAIACKEQVDELPEFDIHGDKIIIHDLKEA